MSKKIVILNGSPRKKGNTSMLVKAFTEGAESAGHTREFDSCIIKKLLTGRIKPVFFCQVFLFYYLVIFSDVWYNYYRGDYYACYYI